MLACPSCNYPLKEDDQICIYCKAPNPLYKATAVSNEPNILHDRGEQLAASKQVSSLMKRYKDAYLVAKVTVEFGTLIKVLAVIAVATISFLTLVLFNQNPDRTQGFIIFVLGAAFAGGIGAVLFVLGILVSAQGQILKASLDSAVNGSPFLTNEHRAKIMSLPES